MRNLILLTSSAALFAGCVPEFATVDEACHETVRSAKNSTDLGLVVQHRMDCHRRVAGLTRGNLDKQVNAAAIAHAQYMSENGAASSTEEQGAAGFTGVTVWDRLEYQEYDTTGIGTDGLYNLYGTVLDGMDAAVWVDEVLMASYTYREVVLQPGWMDGGWGDDGIWIDYIVLHEFPAQEHSSRPIVYPSDGQTDVPVSYYALDPNYDDWTAYGALMGYPITLTFSGYDSVSGDNPYDVMLVDPVLTGPDGEVEVQYSVAGWDQIGTRYTAAVVPLQPLSPSSSYTLTATASWNDEKKDIEVTFQTRTDEEPANSTVYGYMNADLDAVMQPSDLVGLRRSFVPAL